MLKFPVKALAAALLICVSTASAGAIESETTSRMQPSSAPRLDPAHLDQERASRAVRENRGQRHSLSNIRTSPRRARPGPNPRLAHADLPDGERSRVAASPHATDPGAPREAMTRSATRDLRAPSPPSPQRAEPSLAPRMDIADDTRRGRATFKDWLFGR